MVAVETGAVVLRPIARHEAPVLANLFELYAHDFSEYVPLQIKSSGRFEQVPGDAWWTMDDHFPYFLEVHGELAGFALVRVGSRTGGSREAMDMAEFFVLRGSRRRGVGSAAARTLFAAFPGLWEVRVRQANMSAMHFWCGVIESSIGRTPSRSSFSIGGVDWDVFRFETRGTS